MKTNALTWYRMYVFFKKNSYVPFSYFIWGYTFCKQNLIKVHKNCYFVLTNRHSITFVFTNHFWKHKKFLNFKKNANPLYIYVLHSQNWFLGLNCTYAFFLVKNWWSRVLTPAILLLSYEHEKVKINFGRERNI